MSDAQIATRLGLTEATVKCHLRNIFGSPGMSGVTVGDCRRVRGVVEG
jgi:DNA-binding NarL/FixJ family response regulator